MSELKTGHAGHNPWASVANSGPISILSYCGSSILMTVTNKFVVNLKDFNMNFVMLFVQSLVCTITLIILRILGYAKFPFIKQNRRQELVPYFLFTGLDDLHLFEGFTILGCSNLHHFQEFDYYLDCLW